MHCKFYLESCAVLRVFDVGHSFVLYIPSSVISYKCELSLSIENTHTIEMCPV